MRSSSRSTTSTVVMAPNSSTTTEVPSGKAQELTSAPAPPHVKFQRDVQLLPEASFKEEVVWKNVFKLGLLHSFFPLSFFFFWFRVMWPTMAFTIIMATFAGLGVTAGAHRLWSHKSYKARLPLRMVLGIFNCMACQNDIYEWCRDHRVHHKFSETNADPHNVNRGFFFAHVGWLMLKKHPDVIRKGQALHLQDLLDDPVVWWQRRLYFPLATFFGFIVPTLIPHYFWGESLWYSFVVCALGRYCLILNCTWLVNSAAHLWGNKPYDPKISARENRFVTFGALGEGFHNYHHTFPMDYATSEFGWTMNLTTMFIDFMAKIGQVYDRKQAPASAVQKAFDKTGFQTSSVSNGHYHAPEASEDSYMIKPKGQ